MRVGEILDNGICVNKKTWERLRNKKMSSLSGASSVMQKSGNKETSK